MRLARIQTNDGAREVLWQDNQWVGIRSIFDPSPTGERFPADAALLSPVCPRTVVGVSHALAATGEKGVQGWLKSSQTVCGRGAEIGLAPWSTAVVGEGELAVVMGQHSTNLTIDNALDHVLGYTVGNDVTTTSPSQDPVFFAGKSGHNYSPLGPWIETELENPDDAAITVTVDGRQERDSSTANLPHSIAETLVQLSQWITLEPGDVVLTGSPNTAADLSRGCTVAVTINGIGTLENPVS